MAILSYRELAADDTPLMFRLYSAVKSDELGMDAWTSELRDHILRMQFEAQQSGYLHDYPRAVRRLIYRDGVAVGWVIVESGEAALLGIDLALLSEERNRGVGTRVIRELQNEAAASNRPFRIMVQRVNQRALALYTRLGFRIIGGDEIHTLLEWRND